MGQSVQLPILSSAGQYNPSVIPLVRQSVSPTLHSSVSQPVHSSVSQPVQPSFRQPINQSASPDYSINPQLVKTLHPQLVKLSILCQSVGQFSPLILPSVSLSSVSKTIPPLPSVSQFHPSFLPGAPVSHYFRQSNYRRDQLTNTM